VSEPTNDYAKMTDDERKSVLWHFTTLNLRIKAKRKLLKDEPVSMSGNEFKQEMENLAADIRANNAEIKKLMKAARL
jgi:hypothetical protein